MTKKIMLTLLVLLIVVSTTVALVACKPAGAEFEFDKTLEKIGEKAPEYEALDDFIEITDGMSATEMMSIAVHNYEQVGFTAVSQTGNVTTNITGIKVTQAVEGLRIRKNGETYMHNNSITSDGNVPITVKVMEKYFVDKDNGIKLLTADPKKGIELYNHRLYATKYSIDKKFNTLEEYNKENPNDPSRLFMYIVNEDTIESTTTPVKKDGYYEFEVKCNAADAFEDYFPVMNYMLKANSGKVKENSKDGLKLEFKVQIWEDGLFKYYDVLESYDISVVGILNGNVSLKSAVRFTYDENEDQLSKYYDSTKNDFVREQLPADAKK